MSINFTSLATGALAFTIALAWNHAVSQTIKSFFPPTNERAAARANLIYALVVTLLVIFIVAVISHTQRIVHKHRAPPGAREESLTPKPAPPPTAGIDCRECMAQCGGAAPIIRLWAPGPPSRRQ